MAVATLRRKYNSWTQLPISIRISLPLVWLALGASRLAVRLLSFQRLEPLLGARIGASPWIPLLLSGHQTRARLIGLSVQLAARYTPWNSTCFDQAIVARFLLGLYRIPYAVFFGVRRQTSDKSLSAHAWLCAGPVYVVGGNGFGKFTVVNTLVGGISRSTTRYTGDTRASSG